jgi:hypothetical protein
MIVVQLPCVVQRLLELGIGREYEERALVQALTFDVNISSFAN